jgi:hypothetical protein
MNHGPLVLPSCPKTTSKNKKKLISSPKKPLDQFLKEFLSRITYQNSTKTFHRQFSTLYLKWVRKQQDLIHFIYAKLLIKYKHISLVEFSWISRVCMRSRCHQIPSIFADLHEIRVLQTYEKPANCGSLQNSGLYHTKKVASSSQYYILIYRYEYVYLNVVYELLETCLVNLFSN